MTWLGLCVVVVVVLAVGSTDLLLDHSFGPLEPAQRDILHRITNNASNLSRLINDLLNLSRSACTPIRTA